MKKLFMIVVIVSMVMIVGCEEPKLWGKGDPPQDWQDVFGNDNLARLNFKQTETINKQQAVIHGLDGKDPNGVKSHQNGLIDYVISLENRVKALEAANIVDPNQQPIGKYVEYTSLKRKDSKKAFRKGVENKLNQIIDRVNN